MISPFKNTEFSKYYKQDLAAGVAVFFVAVPLCLGIAHASGAPLLAGLISGIIGGIVVGMLSGSQLSVTGPAAGLTAIVINGIETLGSFEGLLSAICFAGFIQIVLGLCRVGFITSYIPTSVIKGMLSAIGVLLIIKQFPHMVGYDIETMGNEAFVVHQQHEQPHGLNINNSFALIADTFNHINNSVMIIGMISLIGLLWWTKYFQEKHKLIPGALLVVISGVLLAVGLPYLNLSETLQSTHFVNIPIIDSVSHFKEIIRSPDTSYLTNPKLYLVGITIAVVASVETLLSTEAIDKIDPLQRRSNNNRELIAQGVGNTLAGLCGGLPLTAVIVRGSVNVAAGAKTKISAITHGLFILIAIMVLAPLMNLIPLASLAAVLVYTGFKLVDITQIKAQFKSGYVESIPFVITIIAIILSDLLIGVCIGMAVAFSLQAIQKRIKNA
ncbi:MAG: SulP family inorganic anion transporter [Bacteroidia bacterium]|jgi:MFS superfamily sulfate permease-like transporter|nr:SulP family inorganic anion transporter [Bacteroidia bacterium]